MKEEVEVEVGGSAGTKGRSGQMLRASVGAGHDRSSVRIAATRREPSEASSRHGTQDGDLLAAVARPPRRGGAVHGEASQTQREWEVRGVWWGAQSKQNMLWSHANVTDLRDLIFYSL